MSQTKAELLDPKGNVTFTEITETVYTLPFNPFLRHVTMGNVLISSARVVNTH